MKKLLISGLALLFVTILSFTAIAKVTTISGKVVKYTASKSIEINDQAGKAHTFKITKDTKVEGEVKVDENVTIEAKDHTAVSIKVEVPAPTPAPAPGTSAPTAPK